MSEEKYIGIRDLDNDRNVTLCIEKDNTLTLLGILNHGTRLDLSINDLHKMKIWCESKLEEAQK